MIALIYNVCHCYIHAVSAASSAMSLVSVNYINEGIVHLRKTYF